MGNDATFYRRSRLFALMVCAVFLTPALTTADESGELAKITGTSVDVDSSITVGDTFVYTVEIEHPTEASIEIDHPPQGSRWSEVDRQTTTDIDGERAITRAEINYAIFRPGTTSGPPISAHVGGPDGPLTFELDDQEIDVDAISDEATALGAPRGAWPLFNEYSGYVWFGVGTASFALVALLAFFALRRRDTDRPPEVEPAPHKVALSALDELQESDLIAEQRWEAFYVRLSGIVRRYLGQRWHFPGTELTTTEIIEKLNAVSDDPNFDTEVRVVARWMQRCDRVKFAGYIPDSDQAESSLSEAYEIVEATQERLKPALDRPENPGHANDDEIDDDHDIDHDHEFDDEIDDEEAS